MSWRILSRRCSSQHQNRRLSRTRRPTLLRRLLRNRVRTVDRFEAVNRDCISPGTHLQGKELAGMNQDLEGASVELGQRLERSVLTNKHKVSRGQSPGKLISRWRPVMRRRQHKTSQSRLDPVLEHCRRQLIRIQELPREAEKVPEQGLGGQVSRIIMWNGTEAKHDQGQVVKPVWTSHLGTQRGLQGTMELLHQAVGLRMKTCCSGM